MEKGKYSEELLIRELETLRKLNATLLEIIGKQEGLKKKRQIEPKVSFRDFCVNLVANSTRSVNTKKDLMGSIGCLDRFQSLYEWEDIDYVFVEDWRRWMTKKGYAPNTIVKHQRNLRTLINEAVRTGHMRAEDNPFKAIRLSVHKGQHRFLSPHELKSMEDVAVEGRLAHTRDAFLFCCYTGLRYSDFRRLSAEAFFMEDGLTWIKMRQKKTGGEIAVPVSLIFGGKAMKVMARYKSIEAFARVGANSRVNSDLKTLQHLAGIRTRITFHTSRHTCATLLCHQGVPITTVQKILGHSSVSTTQIYQDVMRDTIVCDLMRIGVRHTT